MVRVLTRERPAATSADILTLKRAADVLNMDRAYLAKLLDEGVIPFTGCGPQRRVRRADLLTYKRERDTRQARALDDLRDLSIAVGLDEVDEAFLASLP